MERRGFLKTVLAGLAAAPVMAAAETVTTSEKKFSLGVKVKKWMHGGIKFAEWTVPSHVPPYFNEKGDEVMRGITGETLGNTTLRIPKRYVIPVFNRVDDTDATMKELVTRVLSAYSDNQTGKMPVIGQDSKPLKSQDPAYFVLIRVEGRPKLVGMGVFHKELVPVEDFYAGLDKGPDIPTPGKR